MKVRFGSRSWLIAAKILIALFSGPVMVASVWLLAAIASETGFVVLPDGAPRFSGPKGREADVTEIVASREQTGGSVGLFRQTIAPKSGPPTHIHQTEDEFFYVVSGEFKVKLGDRIMSAPAQSVMFVPRGTAHAFQNVGTGPSVILVGVTPGGPRRCSRNGRVLMLRRSERSPKSTTWKWWGRRYSKSPFGGPKARARLSGTAQPPPMHRYGIILLFNGGSSGVLGSPCRGVCL